MDKYTVKGKGRNGAWGPVESCKTESRALHRAQALSLLNGTSYRVYLTAGGSQYVAEYSHGTRKAVDAEIGKR